MLNFTSNSNIVCYNDIILYYLNTDYVDRTNFLYNLSIHIEKLYDNFVLTHEDRRKIILQVNDLVNFLNKFYNNSLNLISKPTKQKSVQQSEEEIQNTLPLLVSPKLDWLARKNIKHGIDIFDILRKTNTTDIFQKELKIFNYQEIDKRIREIINLVGAPQLDDLCKLYNFNINHLSNVDKNIYQVLNKIIVPYNCRYILSKRIDKKISYFEFIENQTAFRTIK